MEIRFMILLGAIIGLLPIDKINKEYNIIFANDFFPNNTGARKILSP